MAAMPFAMGAAGFIDNHLAERLLEKGSEVDWSGTLRPWTGFVK